MKKTRLVKNLEMIRESAAGLMLPLVCLALVALFPTHPLRGGDGHRIDVSSGLHAPAAKELTKIYSVLKYHRTDISEGTAWEIAGTVLEESRKYGVDPMLVLAIIQVESSFRDSAISHRGARGLMQIRPFVANALAANTDLGLDIDTQFLEPWYLDDPVLNIKIGVYYLSRLQKRFGNLQVALTAYNWGPTHIRSRLNGSIPLPLGYAGKVLSAYREYREGKYPPVQVAWK